MFGFLKDPLQFAWMQNDTLSESEVQDCQL